MEIKWRCSGTGVVAVDKRPVRLIGIKNATDNGGDTSDALARASVFLIPPGSRDEDLVTGEQKPLA